MAGAISCKEMRTIFAQCTLRSEAIGMSSTINALIPQGEAPAAGWPVLWLFHGLSDDHTSWCRRTSLERYVDDMGLAVIMPSAHRSFYTNHLGRFRYFDYVSQELPGICRSLFRISQLREDNFTAGLSMGGYGALKVALTLPTRYAAAASLSGVVHSAALNNLEADDDRREELTNIFGDLSKVEGSEHDLVELIRRAGERKDVIPAIYQACGTEDNLYEANTRFRDELRRLGIPFTYEEGPGDHGWAYWDAQIQHVLKWLPLHR